MSDHVKIGYVSPRIQYVADGQQTDFPYPFAIFKEADIKVYVDRALQSAGYSVFGSGVSSGGSVSFITAPSSGTVVTLQRDIVIERTADFQESGPFRAKVINDELDQVTATLQQVEAVTRRSVRLGVTDTNANLELPTKSERADKLLGFDADGDLIARSVDSDGDGEAAILTGSKIKSLYEAEADTNVFRDADKVKLDSISENATSNPYAIERDGSNQVSGLTRDSAPTWVLTEGAGGALRKTDPMDLAGDSGDMVVATYDPNNVAKDAFNMANMVEGANAKVMTTAERTKLAGVEAGATADQSGAEIKSLYEAEADTNVFKDADKAKLGSITENATSNPYAIETDRSNQVSGLLPEPAPTWVLTESSDGSLRKTDPADIGGNGLSMPQNILLSESSLPIKTKRINRVSRWQYDRLMAEPHSTLYDVVDERYPFTPVRFDGTGEHFYRTVNNLSSWSDTGTITWCVVAVWHGFNGGHQRFFSGLRGDITRMPSGRWRVRFFNSGNTAVLNIETTNTFKQADGVLCFCGSADLSDANKRWMQVNGVSETVVVNSYVIDGVMEFTRNDWHVGIQYDTESTLMLFADLDAIGIWNEYIDQATADAINLFWDFDRSQPSTKVLPNGLLPYKELPGISSDRSMFYAKGPARNFRHANVLGNGTGQSENPALEVVGKPTDGPVATGRWYFYNDELIAPNGLHTRIAAGRKDNFSNTYPPPSAMEWDTVPDKYFTSVSFGIMWCMDDYMGHHRPSHNPLSVTAMFGSIEAYKQLTQDEMIEAYIAAGYGRQSGTDRGRDVRKLFAAVRAAITAGKWVCPSIRTSMNQKNSKQATWGIRWQDKTPGSYDHINQIDTPGNQSSLDGWMDPDWLVDNDDVRINVNLNYGVTETNLGPARDFFQRWVEWFLPMWFADPVINANTCKVDMWHYPGHQPVGGVDTTTYFTTFGEWMYNLYRTVVPEDMLLIFSLRSGGMHDNFYHYCLTSPGTGYPAWMRAAFNTGLLGIELGGYGDLSALDLNTLAAPVPITAWTQPRHINQYGGTYGTGTTSLDDYGNFLIFRLANDHIDTPGLGYLPRLGEELGKWSNENQRHEPTIYHQGLLKDLARLANDPKLIKNGAGWHAAGNIYPTTFVPPYLENDYVATAGNSWTAAPCNDGRDPYGQGWRIVPVTVGISISSTTDTATLVAPGLVGDIIEIRVAETGSYAASTCSLQFKIGSTNIVGGAINIVAGGAGGVQTARPGSARTLGINDLIAVEETGSYTGGQTLHFTFLIRTRR